MISYPLASHVTSKQVYELWHTVLFPSCKSTS